MPQKKGTKKTKVQDLKPKKDAKGGRTGRGTYGADKNPTGPGGNPPTSQGPSPDYSIGGRT